MINNNETNNPLVSIVIITYNSAKYVLETLESAKAQTYSNIELIVSDDCSKDNTVAICRDWIEKNKKRFARTRLIESEKNTGIPANCNRGFKEAKGEWVKSIAGDDALYPDSIESYINFLALRPEARIVHARIDCYNSIFSSSALDKEYFAKYPASFLAMENPNGKNQYNLLCICNSIAAPTVFMQHSLWQEMDGYDERILRCEDWPMWLKITNKGIPFYFLDKATTKYRITVDSTFGQESMAYLFRRFFEVENVIYESYIKHNASGCLRFMNRYDFYLRSLLDKVGFNKRTIFSKLVFSFLNIPHKILNKLLFASNIYSL